MQQTEPRLNSLLEAKLTIWICIRIYRRIDKTVKMHTAAIKVYVLVVFSRFRPIIALLGSLMFCLLTYSEEDWGKLGCPTLPEEKAPKLSSFQSTLIAPKPRLSTDRRFSFLENVNLVPDIGPWPQKDKKCDKKFELSASVDTLFCGVYYQWPLFGSWLTCAGRTFKIPPTGRDREKIYQYKPNSQGYPENSFVSQGKGGKNTGP